MKEFRVTVTFRMTWPHFDSTLTDVIMSRLKAEIAQHIDRIEVERVEIEEKEKEND